MSDFVLRRRQQLAAADALVRGRGLLEQGFSDGWEQHAGVADLHANGFASSGARLSPDGQSCVGCGVHRGVNRARPAACGYFGYDLVDEGHSWQVDRAGGE